MSLIGRDDDLADVLEALSDYQLVTLTGPGGVGKSRLSREVAARLASARAQGAVAVDLADIEDSDSVALAIAEGLALRLPSDRASAEGVLLNELADGSRLLVLDNCERLVDAVSGVVGRLLAQSGALRILVTSQQPLNTMGELVWRVEPLAVPAADHEDLPVLLAAPSVQLFADRARLANRHFQLDAVNAPTVAAICRRLDGLPLAIELAASWVSTLSVTEVAERLERDLDLLSTTFAGTRGHESLGAVFARSYSLLAPAEKFVFDRLGVFNGFVGDAVRAVCGPTLDESIDIFAVLTGLVAKSLLAVGNHAGRARYRRLAPARAFGSARLEALPDVEGLRRRHAEWFLGLAEATLSERDPKSLREIEIEHDNFSAALRWAAGGDRRLALRLFVSLRPFWETGGRVGEGLRWADVLLGGLEETAAESDDALVSRALETAGSLALALGDLHRAQRWLESAASRFRAVDDRPGTGRALVGLGVLARYRGDVQGARRLLGEASELVRGQPAESACLAELGRMTGVSGAEPEAERILLRALHLAREQGDVLAAADALNHLGKLAAVRGVLDVAERHHQEALGLQREIRSLRGEARTLGYLGEIAWRRQDYAQSRSLHEQALAVHRRLGDLRGAAMSVGHLAFIEYQRGHPPAAAALYREALGLRRRIGDRRGEAGAMVGLATAIWLADPSEVEMEEARTLVDEAVALHRLSGDPRGLAWALYTRAEIARDQRDVETAVTSATEALEIYRQLGDSTWTTLGLHTLATLAMADGRAAEARPLLVEATGVALAMGNRLQELRCVEVAAHLVLVEGNAELSVLLYGAAHAGRRALGHPPPRRAQRSIGEDDIRTLRPTLGPEAFDHLWVEGQRLSIDQAAAAVLDAGRGRLGRVASGGTDEAREPAGQARRWSLRLLDGVVLEASGVAVSLRGRIPAQVVKITAIRRRVQTDEIIEVLWPDAPPGVGRRRLNNLLARLRREVGDIVVRVGDTLSLDPGVALDVETFVAAADAALAAVRAGDPDAAPLCREAVALYGGELLPGDRYEDWAAAPRLRLARTHLELLDALAEDATASGRPGEAVQWLERGMDAEPLDLARYQRAVRVMLDQGWRHRARQLALRSRRVSDELGLELPAELAELLDFT